MLTKILTFSYKFKDYVLFPKKVWYTITENILVVDDEKEIADLVEVYLKNEDYTVYKCYTAKDAIECIKTKVLDMAILDVMVQETSGFEICKMIREKGYCFPVMMLTAKIQDEDKITGLTLGADDYMTKPFNPLELVARVKSALRRYTKYNGAEDRSEEIQIGGLVIAPQKHECYVYDQKIDLTPIEFDILVYLGERRGSVVPSEELFEQVWKEKYLDNNNTVMVHIQYGE